ncbi:MAG: hypothetical protein H7069_01280 [Phormidesmis sp. FL-bin-119]|nr:hypothetical protein [Pedobacter sp.]
MKKLNLVLFFLLIILAAQAQGIKKGKVKHMIPVNISVSTNNPYVIANNDIPSYISHLLQELNQILDVELLMVDETNDPIIVLNIEIADYNIGTKQEKTDYKTVQNTIVIGKTPSGAAITQKVNSINEQKTIQRKSNAVFKTSIVIKDDPGFKFKKTFSSSYNFNSTETIVDPSTTFGISRRVINPEPKDREYLMLLSKQEMIASLSNEIRKYYQTQTKTAVRN